jgi:hypothetical protein
MVQGASGPSDQGQQGQDRCVNARTQSRCVAINDAGKNWMSPSRCSSPPSPPPSHPQLQPTHRSLLGLVACPISQVLLVAMSTNPESVVPPERVVRMSRGSNADSIWSMQETKGTEQPCKTLARMA